MLYIVYLEMDTITIYTDNHKKILIEKKYNYKTYFYIPHEYLEKNDIEFNNRSFVLNEVGGHCLMLDAYLQGVWIPKEIVECEKVTIDKIYKNVS